MYLGEIRLFAFGRAPEGWVVCEGQVLSVREHQALYSLIGTTYGGDGVKTFNLPDMRGVTPVHQNLDKKDGIQNLRVGMRGGAASVTLLTKQMPEHTHDLRATKEMAAAPSPAGGFLAAKANNGGTAPVVRRIYAEGDSEMVTLDASTIGVVGGNVAHDNMQPYLTLNFCICTQGGDYPPRSDY